MHDNSSCSIVCPVGSTFPVDLASSTIRKAIPILVDFFGNDDDEGPFFLPWTSKIEVVVVPVMPIGGMENHGLIFLNESSAPPKGQKGAKGQQREEELIELIVHELAHHWIGNVVGLPFAFKEGICQVLERCLGDVVQGRPMRKLTVASELASSSLEVKSGSELTGETYQNALNFTLHRASSMGFEAFRQRLQVLCGAEKMGTYVDTEELLATLFA